MSHNTIRDHLWLWAWPPMPRDGENLLGCTDFRHTDITMEDAMQRTGIANLVVGMANFAGKDLREYAPSARRIIVKTGLHGTKPDTEEHFVDMDRGLEHLRAAKQAAAADPRIDGFLVDDFSTGTVTAGVTPEHLARFQFVNASEYPHLPYMGTMYTMSLDLPQLPALLPHFAYFLTPLWHADQIDTLPAAVRRLAELSGGKPQLLCVYLWDFGNGRAISYDLMQRQLEVSQQLLIDREVFGVLFLGTWMLDQDWDATRAFDDWLQRVGDRQIQGPTK